MHQNSIQLLNMVEVSDTLQLHVLTLRQKGTGSGETTATHLVHFQVVLHIYAGRRADGCVPTCRNQVFMPGCRLPHATVQLLQCVRQDIDVAARLCQCQKRGSPHESLHKRPPFKMLMPCEQHKQGGRKANGP